jgi:hypothetical protein
MKSHQATLALVTLTLISSAIPAAAQRIQAVSDRVATRVEAGRSASDSQCRKYNPMQSWSYESCLQQLPASAAIGGRE